MIKDGQKHEVVLSTARLVEYEWSLSRLVCRPRPQIDLNKPRGSREGERKRHKSKEIVLSNGETDRLGKSY